VSERGDAGPFDPSSRHRRRPNGGEGSFEHPPVLLVGTADETAFPAVRVGARDGGGIVAVDQWTTGFTPCRRGGGGGGVGRPVVLVVGGIRAGCRVLTLLFLFFGFGWWVVVSVSASASASVSVGIDWSYYVFLVFCVCCVSVYWVSVCVCVCPFVFFKISGITAAYPMLASIK